MYADHTPERLCNGIRTNAVNLGYCPVALKKPAKTKRKLDTGVTQVNRFAGTT